MKETDNFIVGKKKGNPALSNSDKLAKGVNLARLMT